MLILKPTFAFRVNMLFALFFCINTLQAAEVFNKTQMLPSTIKNIKISGTFELKLISSSESNISILAEEHVLDKISIENENENISVIGKGFVSQFKPEVIIKLPLIDHCSISGTVTGTFDLKQSNFFLNTNGVSNLKIKGDVSNFNLKAQGTSTIDAQSLRTSDIFLDLSGISNIYLNKNTGNIHREHLSGIHNIHTN